MTQWEPVPGIGEDEQGPGPSTPSPTPAADDHFRSPQGTPFAGVGPVDAIVFSEQEISPELHVDGSSLGRQERVQRAAPQRLTPRPVVQWQPGGAVDPSVFRRARSTPHPLIRTLVVLLALTPFAAGTAILAWVLRLYGLH